VIEARVLGGDQGMSLELFLTACSFMTPNSSESEELMSEF